MGEIIGKLGLRTISPTQTAISYLVDAVRAGRRCLGDGKGECRDDQAGQVDVGAGVRASGLVAQRLNEFCSRMRFT